MSITLSEFAFGIIINLVSNAIQKAIDFSSLDFFEQLNIKRHVEKAVAEIVKPLISFLENEKIDDAKQHRLIQTCVDELFSYSQNPEKLFQNSLNGQKIFDGLYKNKPLPEVVIEDGVKEVYILLFPRIAEILCKIPNAIKEWESLAWKEDFRRLDEIASELRKLFILVDELHQKPRIQADEILIRIKRAMVQKIGLEMDITGLRGDETIKGKLSEFFVHPVIQEILQNEEDPNVINNTTEAINQFSKTSENKIIIGVAGAGKSTWTKWFQRELLINDDKGIGIRVELRDCKIDNLPSIFELVREAPGKHYSEEITAEIISRWLEQHLLVFILDGFDEIVSKDREEVYEWIMGLNQASRGCPIILTSRPLTTDHLYRQNSFLSRWEIKPFDLPRIIEYIQHWYNHISVLSEAERNVDAKTLATSWQGDPTLAPLTSNPLLLSTLLMVHKLDGQLPSGRSLLYQRYIDGMLGIWDDRRKLKTMEINLSLKQKKKFLRCLALFMFLQEKDQLEEKELLIWLKNYILENNLPCDADDVLRVLRERTGLIIGPGIYTFSHNTIAEYLVAETVWNGDQKDNDGKTIDRMYLFERLESDHWNTVIFLWAGLASIADLVTFIKLCLEVKNWSLAFGVLLDQFDRIDDRNTRRELIFLNNDSESIELFPKSNHTFTYSTSDVPKKSKKDFTINSEDLRGIRGNSSYYDLVKLSIDTKTINFDDRKKARIDELRDFIWFIHCGEIEYYNEVSVKDFFANRSPLCETDDYWAFFIYSRFISSIIYQSDNLVDGLTFCHKFFPDFDSKLPLLLIARFVYNIYYVERVNKSNKSNNNEDITNKILSALMEVKNEKIDHSWLLDTKDWTIPRFMEVEEEEHFDILKHFLKVRKLVSTNQAINLEMYDRLRKHIINLIKERN